MMKVSELKDDGRNGAPICILEFPSFASLPAQ